MSAVEFAVEGVPVPQGSMRSLGRRMIHSNHAALMAWRGLVAAAAETARGDFYADSQPVLMKVVFHLPRPKTVKREWPTAKGDLDKHVRSIGDALTGVLFHDDGQVIGITAAKQYATDWVGAVITVTDDLELVV